MFANLQLEQALQQKYGEEFIVREDGYSLELGLNVFMASPKQYPELVFEGRHKDNIIILDYYPEVLWNFEAEKLVRDRLKKENILCWVKCFVVGSNRFDSNDKLIHFDKLLNQHDTSVTIASIIYLFEDINDQNKQRLLKPVQDLAIFYNKAKDKNISVSVYFWDKSFTKGKKFEEMYFTYNVNEWIDDPKKEFGDKNDDGTQSKIKYIKHSLKIRYCNSVLYDFSVPKLYSLVRTYDITDHKSNVFKKDGSVNWEY